MRMITNHDKTVIVEEITSLELECVYYYEGCEENHITVMIGIMGEDTPLGEYILDENFNIDDAFDDYNRVAMEAGVKGYFNVLDFKNLEFL